jgi:hypothetical protein
MIDQTEIKNFVTNARRAIDADPQMNEAMTRKAILDQFCDLLGWSFPPARVEYPVEAFGRQFEVDYAYLHKDSERAFIEAKGIDTPLREKHAEQLKAYLKNGGAKLGILTNGKKYEFYRRVTTPEIEVKQAAILKLQGLPDRPEVLQEFTHNSLSEPGDGVIDIVQERELHETLQSQKSEIAAEVERTIVEHTKGTISGGEFRPSIRSHIDTAAKSAVDTLALRVEPNSSGGSGGSGGSGNDGDDTEDGYFIEIKSQETSLESFSGDTQTDTMAEAVNYLIENHGLESKVKPLPYIPGREKAIINDQPTSPHDEEAMRIYRELSGGYYLDTHMSATRKKQYVEKFASKCQLTVTFSGDW